ncbi:unnamed protein product [Rhizophagus irregularis]|nr:unnamed protein product [Rhizophagus irregularis]
MSDLDFDHEQAEQPNDLDNERENERSIEESDIEEEDVDFDKKSTSSKHSWGSTSGMSSHIRSKHKLLIDENDKSNQNKKQITLQESFQNSAETMSYNENNFRKLLVRYVVMGDHSFLSIESKDFHNLIHLLL